MRRSGPLVAMVTGDAVPDESHKLLDMVHYESDLTSIPQPTESEVAKTGTAAAGVITLLVLIGCERVAFAGFFSGRLPGALPHGARQAGLLGLRMWSSSG